MGFYELWQKIKTLSTVGDAKHARSPKFGGPPYLVDFKEARHTTSYPEPGKSCNTCQHYLLGVELREGQHVPPEPQHDYDEEELINLVKLPIYYGYCSRFLKHGAMLYYGVRSDAGCIFWEEKPVIEQFDDNVIEQDDGRTPVQPKVIMEL